MWRAESVTQWVTWGGHRQETFCVPKPDGDQTSHGKFKTGPISILNSEIEKPRLPFSLCFNYNKYTAHSSKAQQVISGFALVYYLSI